METKPRILPSILYSVAGLIVLLLCVKEPLVILMVCVLASAFLLAGSLLWDKAAYLSLLLGAGILYLRTGSLLYTLIAIAGLAGLVLAGRACIRAKQPLAVIAGVPALTAAVAAVVVLSAYLYITRGALDFSGLMPSLSQIKTAIDEAVYDPLLAAAQTTQMTPEEIEQYITMILTAKNVYLDAIFAVLPGFVMSLLFVLTWASQMLAKVLLGKKFADRITIEPIWKLSLPVGIGVVFLLAFIVSFFVDGTLASVLDNLITAFEIPLLLCGAFTVYTLFTRRAVSRGSKVLTALLVTLTAVGIPISFGIAYVLVGAIDSIADLRRRFRGEDAPMEENERLKQWNSFQEMKPGNDAEASEELDIPEDDDENEGEDQ